MKVKYMGSADIRRLEKGEDFGGRLGEPLDRDIEWNWDNKHVIDTEEFSSVDDEFWSLLLDDPEFKDVSGMKRIPTNGAQQTWRAMPKHEEGDEERAVSSASSVVGQSSAEAALAASGSSTADAPPAAPKRRQ